MTKKAWNRLFKNKVWGKYPDLSLVRAIKKQYKKGLNNKCLEVGFGGGANLSFLALENFKTYGIDHSVNAKIQTQKLLQKFKKKANLKISDCTKIPFKNNFFDLAIDCECLYSLKLDDFKQSLIEIKRVLKYKKIFISKTFASNSYHDGYKKKIKNEKKTFINQHGLIKRYMNKSDIYKIYGKYFKIINLEKETRTIQNNKNKIVEWTIVMKNEQ